MRKHKGFTLIELVVVVMILGILAAVAAPKLLNTSSTATDNGLRQTLNTVRSAIERYAAENGGQLPAANSSDPEVFRAALKEYLRGPFPASPVGNKNNDVEIVTGPIGTASGSTSGWKYSRTTGEFICNSDLPVKSEDDLQFTYDKL
jgi:general secretion pathway protein G